MKREVLIICLAALIANMQLPVSAQMALIPGQVAHERVAQLTSQIPWYSSLCQAEDTARRTNRMILWVHMLGDLKGAT
jgi:hypothetical protein